MPGLFESLGQWLACFVMELNEYLPVKVNYVEDTGPLGELGQLARAGAYHAGSWVG